MIGETSKKLPDDLKARHGHLPWREMATFRNFASHDYFGVDARLVWQAAMSLEPIRTMVLAEVARLEKAKAEPYAPRSTSPRTAAMNGPIETGLAR
jgi:uncharacterized protein with HEPN domain